MVKVSYKACCKSFSISSLTSVATGDRQFRQTAGIWFANGALIVQRGFELGATNQVYKVAQPSDALASKNGNTEIMIDLNKPGSPTGTSPEDGAGNKPPKSFLTWVMIFFVVPVMALWEGFRALHKRVYEQGAGGSLRQILGVLTGLAAGIGVGYFHGYQAGWSWFSWLPAGVGTTLLTYAYFWPLAYLGLLRPFHVLSKELWDAVPRRNHWFTDFLKTLSRFAVIGGAGFLSWTQAVVAHGNLTHNGWGIFAYVGAFAWMAFIAVLTSAIGWSLLTTSIAGICAGSGAALTYALYPLTQSTLASFGLGYPGVAQAVAVLEFAIYVAFVFPLGHVIASHGLRFIKDGLRKLYTSAYETKIGIYEGVFTQLVNIWTAWHLATLTVALLVGLGYTPIGWIAIAIPVAVGLLSYLLVGQIFRAFGNHGLGVVAAAHGARYAVLALLGTGVAVGWLIAGGALAAALTFFLAYPLAYVIVRLVGQLVLNNKVAGVLITAHDKFCTAAQDFLREVARARKNTYGDQSWFSKLFLHTINVVALLPVWYSTSGFLTAVGTTGALATGLTVLALVLSYLLVGRLLVAAENYLVGAALALTGAVATGIFTFAAQPYGLWGALPAAVLGGTLVAGWLFPIAYVFTKFALNLVDSIVPLFSKVVEPVVRGLHRFFWGKAAGLVNQFTATYRMVREAIKPTWASIRKSWNDAWQSVKDTWESIKRR